MIVSDPFTTMEIYAVSNARVTQWFVTLHCETDVSTVFLNGKSFLERVRAKRMALQRSNLRIQFREPSEFCFFHGTRYVSICIQERQSHATLQGKTGSCVEVATQLTPRARSVLVKFTS